MALTRVRSPITAIDEMSFGTTSIVIPSTGGPIDIDVTGLNVMDMTSTTVDVDDLVTLTANLFATEVVTLATSGGAEGTIFTDATTMTLGTTTPHVTNIQADGVVGLTALVTGQVALGTVGSGVDRLVDKDYVDTADALALSLSNITATIASTGSITIPNSTGNDLIINWGKNGSVANNTNTVVTFDTAFTSAQFVGFAQPTTSQNHDGTMETFTQGLTTMTIHSSLDQTSAFDWLAIGF